MIINTGRGQLIHTNALIEGLKNKKIGSAGLDVYEEESEYFYEDQSDKIIDDDTLRGYCPSIMSSSLRTRPFHTRGTGKHCFDNLAEHQRFYEP